MDVHYFWTTTHNNALCSERQAYGIFRPARSVLEREYLDAVGHHELFRVAGGYDDADSPLPICASLQRQQIAEVRPNPARHNFCYVHDAPDLRSARLPVHANRPRVIWRTDRG